MTSPDTTEQLPLDVQLSRRIVHVGPEVGRWSGHVGSVLGGVLISTTLTRQNDSLVALVLVGMLLGQFFMATSPRRRNMHPRLMWSSLVPMAINAATLTAVGFWLTELWWAILATLCSGTLLYAAMSMATAQTMLHPIQQGWRNPCHADRDVIATVKGHDYRLRPGRSMPFPAVPNAHHNVNLVTCECGKVLAKDGRGWFKVIFDDAQARHHVSGKAERASQ